MRDSQNTLKKWAEAARPPSMRRYLAFFVVSLALFVGSINGTAITVAFPQIIADFNTNLIMGGWILTAYQLVSIAALPVAAKLTDTLGRRRSFLLFTVTFTVSSAFCAVAPNAPLLIVLRTLQSIGGAGFLPCAAGIVSDEFPQSRQQAIGLFASIFPIGMIAGPNIGAWLVEAWGWRSTFWFTVLLGAIVLLLAWMLIRETRAASGSWAGLDLVGTGWFTALLFVCIAAITQLAGARDLYGWLIEAALFAGSTVLAILFVKHERRTKAPIIDFVLLREKPFLASNAYNVVFGLCALGVFSLVPLYATSVYGLSVVASGFVLTPRYFGMVATSAVTSLLLTRIGYRRPILAGSVIVAAVLATLAIAPKGAGVLGFEVTPTTLLLIVMFFSGAGLGIAAPAANNACIDLMPDRIPTIVGIRAMFRGIGGSIGIAVSTLILETLGDMSQAFYITFMVWAVAMLAIIPTVFAMPARPTPKAGRS